MKKALFSDLDGTLLNDGKQVTPVNRAAIEKMTEAGHCFIVTTGRPLASALIQAEKLGLTYQGCYLIAFNGGILYDMGKQAAIMRYSLPLPLVCRVFDLAREMQVYVQTYSETKVLLEDGASVENAARYCGRIDMEYETIPTIRCLKREPEKILAIDYEGRVLLDSFRKCLMEREHEFLDTYYSCREYLDIIPKGLHKGSALVRMAELLEIPIENTIAAGDAENDLTMIQAAGIGVAMQNAVPEVKAVADFITTQDNNHHGVSEIIERFILR